MPGLPGWSVAAALDVMGAAGISAPVLSISSPGVHFGDDSLEETALPGTWPATSTTPGAEIAASQPGRFGLSAVLPLPDVNGALPAAAQAGLS